MQQLTWNRVSGIDACVKWNVVHGNAKKKKKISSHFHVIHNTPIFVYNTSQFHATCMLQSAYKFNKWDSVSFVGWIEFFPWNDLSCGIQCERSVQNKATEQSKTWKRSCLGVKTLCICPNKITIEENCWIDETIWILRKIMLINISWRINFTVCMESIDVCGSAV